jgi:SAM-dependent methyltransferase
MDDRLERARSSGGASTRPLHDLAIAELDRLGATGTALDFGAGNGALSARLSARSGIERVIAIDLVPIDAPAAGVETIVSDLNDPLPLPDASIDAIVAVGVLEYLENPYAVAREWHRVLAPGGALVGTVPNSESLRALLNVVVRGRFAAVDNPRHDSPSLALLRSDVRRTLDRAGFLGASFRPSGRGSMPGLTSVTWQELSRGRLRGLRFSDDVLFSAVRPG